MDLLSDIVQAVQDDLTIGSESTLYPPALIKRVINRSYRKATGLYRWPELEDAKKTNTEVNQEYYDYPDTWQPDSMWKLKVDGEDYGDPLVFKDYLNEKEATSTQYDKMWSSQWRRFFIYPTPTALGSSNICIWGQKIATALTTDSSVTIFSYSMPECNEAIELETVAMLKGKGDKQQSGQFLSLEAKQILTVAWNKIRQNQTKYEKTQPMFEVPDFFSRGGAKQNTGRFD